VMRDFARIEFFDVVNAPISAPGARKTPSQAAHSTPMKCP